jgi:16S rRNA (uracil1498-N3)-methyltransferase
MALRRFFLEQVISGRKLIIRDQELAQRLTKVLRLKVGDQIIVFDKLGSEFLAKIELLSKNRCELEIIEKRKNLSEPEKKIHLFQAIIKKDKFEWVIEKGTEVGVYSFTPILTERTVKFNLNFERLKKIAISATEQSGRVFVPIINKIKTFEEAIKENKENFLLFLDLSGEPIKKFFPDIQKAKEIYIFVGPEGGWSEKEIEIAKNNNAKIVNLGPRILRSETLAPVISTLILNI